jgi:hypothetical protein
MHPSSRSRRRDGESTRSIRITSGNAWWKHGQNATLIAVCATTPLLNQFVGMEPQRWSASVPKYMPRSEGTSDRGD